MGTNHWYAIYERSIENPESVIEVLMDSQQVKIKLFQDITFIICYCCYM